MSTYERGVHDERNRCLTILRGMIETAQMELDGVAIYGLQADPGIWSSSVLSKAYALTALQRAESEISNTSD